MSQDRSRHWEILRQIVLECIVDKTQQSFHHINFNALNKLNYTKVYGTIFI